MKRPIEIPMRAFRWLGLGLREDEGVIESAFLGAIMTVLLITAVTASGYRLYSVYGSFAPSSSSLAGGD